MSGMKGSYVCAFEGCAASFKRLDRLKSHSKLHSNERPYICSYDDCGKSYTQKQHLKRHENTHEEIYRCTEEGCDQTFNSKVTLKKHIYNIHLKKKPKSYKCSYCDEQFNKHSWLKHHEYKHTGIKPYVCPEEFCAKRFSLPSKLNRHLKVHEGYTCTKPNCSETFSKWTLYLKHLKVAHPIIFKCSICERQFSTLSNLKAHIDVHQNSVNREEFECTHPNCSRFYYAQRNLTHHIKSYHENRPFVCKVENCFKTFKTENDVTRHYHYRHDPNKRLRKKKKKTKSSFAAVLSGYVQKEKRKTGKSKLKPEVVVGQELIHEDRLNASKEKPQDQNNFTSAEEKTDESELEIDVIARKSTNHEDCLNTSEEKNEVENNISSDEGIQTLLNMINERNALNTKSACLKEQYVSFKEFIKL